VRPILFDYTPEAFPSIKLAPFPEVLVEDGKVELDVVNHQVLSPVSQNESPDVIRVNDDVLQPIAGGHEPKRRYFVAPDRGSFAIQCNELSSELLASPASLVAKSLVPEYDPTVDLRSKGVTEPTGTQSCLLVSRIIRTIRRNTFQIA